MCTTVSFKQPKPTVNRETIYDLLNGQHGIKKKKVFKKEHYMDLLFNPRCSLERVISDLEKQRKIPRRSLINHKTALTCFCVKPFHGTSGSSTWHPVSKVPALHCIWWVVCNNNRPCLLPDLVAVGVRPQWCTVVITQCLHRATDGHDRRRTTNMSPFSWNRAISY